MEDSARRYFDEGNRGDWILVGYRVGMNTVEYAEGEFGGYGRTKRGTWFLHLTGITLIPTVDIVSIRVLAYAGCL